MLMLIDTHIHLYGDAIKSKHSERFFAARRAGIVKFVVPGVRYNGWGELIELASANDDIFFAPGLHPAYAKQWSLEVEQSLRQLIASQRVVAIGEIGLDGTVELSLAQQEKVLRGQLQIALEAKLPVLLHARQATGKLLAILRELQIGVKFGGIWHGFSGSLQVAHELVALGFKLGVGPILLRKTARKLPAVVRELPATAFVLETDFPDMAEAPTVLLQVAERVAELRGWSLEETAQITSKNANQLFRF